MTARGLDEGIDDALAAGDAIAEGCVRELLEAFKPGAETEVGPQAAKATRSMAPTLVLMRS